MRLFRQETAKRAWGKLQARAERGEKFGFIACLGVLYKSGKLTRAEVLEKLKESHITREDLRKFREQISK